MGKIKIHIPSLEEVLKWLWESANLFIEDCVRILEWLRRRLKV